MLLFQRELYLHGSVMSCNWQIYTPTLEVWYPFERSIVLAPTAVVPFDTQPFTRFAGHGSDIPYCT